MYQYIYIYIYGFLCINMKYGKIYLYMHQNIIAFASSVFELILNLDFNLKRSVYAFATLKLGWGRLEEKDVGHLRFSRSSGRLCGKVALTLIWLQAVHHDRDGTVIVLCVLKNKQ